MANHKKAWSADDVTLNKLKFPQLPASELYQVPEHGELALSDFHDNRPMSTGLYKYRCTVCGEYYNHDVNHTCIKTK